MKASPSRVVIRVGAVQRRFHLQTKLERTRPPNPSKVNISEKQEICTPPDVCRPWLAPMSFSGKEKIKGSGDPTIWLWFSYAGIINIIIIVHQVLIHLIHTRSPIPFTHISPHLAHKSAGSTPSRACLNGPQSEGNNTQREIEYSSH